MYRLHRPFVIVALAVGSLILGGCASTTAGSGVAAPTSARESAEVPTARTTVKSVTTARSSALPTASGASSAGSLTGTSAPSGTASDSSVYVAPTECLLTEDEVSSVLGGEWSRVDNSGGDCTYSSDRGARFGVTPIDYAPDELADAMAEVKVTTCDSQPVDVPGTAGGFVCIQQDAGGQDLVEGNLIVRDYFWLFIIQGAGDDPTYPAQTKALVALLGAADQ